VEPFLREAATVKLCKAYGLEDARQPDPLWQDLLRQLKPNWQAEGALHRKYWEWGLGLYGLHTLGCIRPDAVALGVGSGIEWPLFYLANRVQRVHATDLYSVESHFEGPDPTVAANAARVAPFPYRREALLFQRMNALDLRFDDATFDFVFTFSSIEHFGGHAGAALATQEIARVLKPGGIAAIATELIVNGPRHPEFFMPGDLEPCFVGTSGLQLVEPLDLRIDDELISNPVRFEYPPGFKGDTGPHTSVVCGNLTFTSVEFFLRKPPDWKPAAGLTLARLRAQRQGWLLAQRARPRLSLLRYRLQCATMSRLGRLRRLVRSVTMR
jgi:SAM-dependent methyltransferase